MEKEEQKNTVISEDIIKYGKDLIKNILKRFHADIYEATPENIDVLMWKDFCFDPEKIDLGIDGGINIHYKIQKLQEYQQEIRQNNDNNYQVLMIAQEREKNICSFIAYQYVILQEEKNNKTLALYIDLLCTKPMDYIDMDLSSEKIYPCHRCSSKGYATILLFRSILEAIEKKEYVKTIMLEALPDNKLFYEKFGFKEIIQNEMLLETRNLLKTVNICISYLEKIQSKIYQKNEMIHLKKRKQNNI